MALLASDIIEPVARDLQDTSYTRWTLAMHYEMLTAAMQAAIIIDPGANAVTEAVELTAESTRQSIPTGGYRLIDIVRNMGSDGATPGAPVTLTDRDSLDDNNSAWHTDDPADEIDHFVYDERNPEVFYVTPPPDADVYVELVYSAEPTAVTALTDTLDVSAVYKPALMEYVKYRAFGVNNAAAQDFEKARQHLANFYLLLGQETKARILYSPNENNEATNG